MAMLIRTRSRQIALTLRIICILSVSVTYLIISVVSIQKSEFGVDWDDIYGENLDISNHKIKRRDLTAVEFSDIQYLKSNITDSNLQSTNATNFIPYIKNVTNKSRNITNTSSDATNSATTTTGVEDITNTQVIVTNAPMNEITNSKSNNFERLKNITRESHRHKNCTRPAIKEFPSDGLTRRQRKEGWVIIHILLACYFFVLLAVVCDNYFVPAIKKFCDNLHMKEDIAGATLMATAGSSAEIFINSIGTFITEGDLGVGTIVGSAVFNILAVPACCGLFANMVLDLEWWPISRDSLIYIVSVIMLISFLQDGEVHMYEALALVLMYTFYILIMIYNDRLQAAAHRVVAKLKRKSYYKEVLSEAHPLLFQKNGKYDTIHEILESEVTLKDCEELEESTKIWEWPKEDTKCGKVWWMLTWPIMFVLYMTTPDCRNHPRLYVVTFLMCIFWIATTSYSVAWLITVIGDTLEIPDSVMGLTFLAAGTSVPEAVSAVIVTNQGHGSMGISSSIGSNTFDILLCLGIPWLIKSAFYPTTPGEHWIKINSAGINYSAGCLLITTVLLYISVCANKFKMDWKVGLTCLFLYIGFLVFASLIELNVFFPVNMPTCGR